MDEEIQYPGLVGAGIEPAQRSPYDRSFVPGEATTEDVRAGLIEMFLSGLGLVPGGVMAASGPRKVHATRPRRLGPDVQTRNRTVRDVERAARPSGYPATDKPRVGPSVQEMQAILAALEAKGQ